jgi:sugar lactone lactonase YvrE
MGKTNRRLGAALAAAIALRVLPAPAGAQPYAFALLAGAGSVLDHTDGTGGNARFFNPSAVAVDGSGNLYVADGGDHTVRKVTAGGVVTTLAGSSGQPGSGDGSGTNATFLYPYAVAVDASGNVYVADSGNNNIRMITAGGSVTTLAGAAGFAGSADGTGAAALFNAPQGIAVDASGNIYVSDTNNGTVRRVTAAGAVTTLAGAAGQMGASDGTGASARFSYPEGLAVDAAGNVYVADFDNCTVRKVTPAGSVATLAGSAGNAGSADGQGGAALFNHPEGVAVDGAGNVYVIDTSNQTVREISPGGGVTTLAGSPTVGGSADGAGAAASFFYPGGIASTGAGVVFIADTGNHTIRTMAPPGNVSTVAGAAGVKGDADGTGSSALFAYPYGIAWDGAGHLYVADSANDTIREVTPAGVVTTFAGTSGIPGSADGAAASFNSPAGVAVDASGNVYVADAGNSTIRKIAGGIVTTFAGVAGVAGSSDGTGSAAHFNAPAGIAVDAVGDVFVADTNNDTIREITSGGTVTTLAGVAGQSGSGDGAGGSARFNSPHAVAVDGSGNVYVSDFSNATIRKIDTSDTVTTLAGSAGMTGFADGVGVVARFNQPYSLAVDGSGNVFVADTYNRAIRKITPGGSVTTLNGSQARFYYPQGIAVDGSGNLYVDDGDNQSVSAGAAVVAPPAGGLIASQSITSGQNATFTLGTAAAATTYQWQTSVDSGTTWTDVSNNATFSGATTTTLTVTDPSTSMSGDVFEVQLSNLAGSSTSGSATLTVTAAAVTGAPAGGGPGGALITNLSIRSFVGTGASAVSVGFVISGSGSKQMLIRGVGPTLTAFGVGGVLSNPQLTLFNSKSVQIGSNTGWGGAAALAAAFSSVGAFALPATSADSVLFVPLAAGTAYTAQISGVNGSTGVALAELYDADGPNPPTRLTNVSARALSGSGSAVLTAGFTIGGSGMETLLIRGIGPGLTQFGVAGVLAAPQITVFNSSSASIGSNAGWGGGSALTAAFAQVGAFPLPATSLDSAILVTLPAGSYSAQVGSANGSTGIALVEIYEVN